MEVRVFEKAYERYHDRPAIARRLKRQIADRLLRLARRLLKSGESEEAALMLVKARGLTPFASLKAAWIVLTVGRKKGAEG